MVEGYIKSTPLRAASESMSLWASLCHTAHESDRRTDRHWGHTMTSWINFRCIGVGLSMKCYTRETISWFTRALCLLDSRRLRNTKNPCICSDFMLFVRRVSVWCRLLRRQLAVFRQDDPSSSIHFQTCFVSHDYLRWTKFAAPEYRKAWLKRPVSVTY